MVLKKRWKFIYYKICIFLTLILMNCGSVGKGTSANILKTFNKPIRIQKLDVVLCSHVNTLSKVVLLKEHFKDIDEYIYNRFLSCLDDSGTKYIEYGNDSLIDWEGRSAFIHPIIDKEELKFRITIFYKECKICHADGENFIYDMILKDGTYILSNSYIRSLWIE